MGIQCLCVNHGVFDGHSYGTGIIGINQGGAEITQNISVFYLFRRCFPINRVFSVCELIVEYSMGIHMVLESSKLTRVEQR